MDWLENVSNPDDLLLVAYEDVKFNTNSTLRRISDFLDMPVDEKRMSCILANPKGFFKRETKPEEKQQSEPLDLFDKEFRDLVWAAIDTLNKALKKKGLGELPLNLYKGHKVKN